MIKLLIESEQILELLFVLGAPACHAAWDTPVHRKEDAKHSPKEPFSSSFPPGIQNS